MQSRSILSVVLITLSMIANGQTLPFGHVDATVNEVANEEINNGSTQLNERWYFNYPIMHRVGDHQEFKYRLHFNLRYIDKNEKALFKLNPSSDLKSIAFRQKRINAQTPEIKVAYLFNKDSIIKAIVYCQDTVISPKKFRLYGKRLIKLFRIQFEEGFIHLSNEIENSIGEWSYRYTDNSQTPSFSKLLYRRDPDVKIDHILSFYTEPDRLRKGKWTMRHYILTIVYL